MRSDAPRSLSRSMRAATTANIPGASESSHRVTSGSSSIVQIDTTNDIILAGADHRWTSFGGCLGYRHLPLANPLQPALRGQCGQPSRVGASPLFASFDPIPSTGHELSLRGAPLHTGHIELALLVP